MKLESFFIITIRYHQKGSGDSRLLPRFPLSVTNTPLTVRGSAQYKKIDKNEETEYLFLMSVLFGLCTRGSAPLTSKGQESREREWKEERRGPSFCLQSGGLIP